MVKRFGFFEQYVVDGARIMLWLFLATAVTIFLVHSLLSLAFPFPLDYGEAPLLDQALRLSAGQNIYQPSLAAPPYTIANYPPLYVFSLTPFVQLFGPNFWAGRLISILSALATALFLGLMVTTFSRNRPAGLVTGLLFLANPFVTHWSGLLRIDLLALALSTAGLALLVRRPADRSRLIAGGVLLVAAIYTRQSYALAAPLAATLWLWSHDRRRALGLVGLIAGLSLVLFLGLNLWTGGGFFFNIVTANINPFEVSRMLGRLAEAGFTGLILLGFALALILLGRNRAGWSLVSAYALGALLSSLTVGKIGSNVNYFLELSAALSLAAGMGLAWSQGSGWRYGLALLLLVGQTGLFMHRTLNVFVDERLTPRRQDHSAIFNLAQLVADSEGPLLADEYLGLLTLQGRSLYAQPFEISQLARAGRWDQTDLLTAINEQRFPLILIHHFPFSQLHKERWTPQMLAAIEQRYRPVRVQAGSVVYLPQPDLPGSQVPEAATPNSLAPAGVRLGPLTQVSQASFVAQPGVAVSPANPDHLAVLVNSTSAAECDDLSGCQLELLLYTSTDGGASWSEQPALSKGRQATVDGVAVFNPAGLLYVLGIRDGAITLNWSQSEDRYQMTRTRQTEVTRAQVAGRPWLRIDPYSGTFYLTYLGQFRDIFAGPSLNRSTDGGATWSVTSHADQWTAISEINTLRVTPPADIQPLPGQAGTLALLWRWSAEPWAWPQGVWWATSTDGGESFATPRQIATTWGAITGQTHQGNDYVLFRAGSEQSQQLVLARSADGGANWSATRVNGEIPLAFDVDKGPGFAIAPDGTLDILFYAHADPASPCVLQPAGWPQALRTGRTDTCRYNVYYTFSRDGGQSFSQPLQLNEAPIAGERFSRRNGFSWPGSPMGMASTDRYAYPIWLDTAGERGSQAWTVRIER
jgi:hypothetical protein